MATDVTLPSAGAINASGTRLRAVVAATLGNTLEWFDFAVYGFFALTIAKLFFPTGNETVSLLITVATFGVGFVMRPVGALVLGSLADKHGRKAALSTTILLMAFGTGLIGVAPTYETAGLWAPAIIALARLIQGFSAGGEVGGATAFLIESAPRERRGFFASFQQASQALALLLGSLFGAALTGLLSPAALESWGWRVPFLFGLLIGPIGWYIRTRTHDSDEFRRSAQTEAAKAPIRAVFRQHGRSVIAGFGVTILWTVCTYFFLIYMPTFATRQLKIDQSAALLANSAGLLVLLGLVPVFGALSDRVGRRPLLLTFGVLIMLAAYPLLYILSGNPSTGTLVLIQVIFAVLIAGFSGPAPGAIADLYPPEVRSTGLAVSYSFAVTIFGGFAPFIVTWLIATTGSNFAPAWYVIFAAVLSLCALAVPSDRWAPQVETRG